MTRTGSEEARRWKLKPIILAWIIPILLANFLLGVILNYYMAKENDRKRIADHILQRRMDLVFLANLPDLRIYFIDLKLALNEEAEFVKEDVQIYLSSYLKNLNPPFPHVLSVVSLLGEELVRIKNGEIEHDYRNFSDSPFLRPLTQGREQTTGQPPPPVLPESPWFGSSTLLHDALPIFDEINNRVIGGVIYEYQVPVELLTAHTRQVLIFNLTLGLSIGAGALLVLYFALGNIIKPLNRLTAASQEILTGDLSREVRVQGWGEVSILAATFETMRQQLRNQFEQLKDNTRKLAAIIDFLPDATFVVDREGRVISWNRAMEAMSGVAAEDMLGKGDYDYAIPFYGERRPVLLDLVFQPQKSVEGRYAKIERGDEGILVAETSISNLKGGSLYLLATAAPLYDHRGNLVGAIESLRDITERKQAEDERMRLVTAIEQSAEAIFIIDTHWIIQYANPSSECMTGYPRSELIGQHSRILKSDKHDQAFYRNIRETLSGGRVWAGRLTNRKKDGSLYEAEVNTSPVREKSGVIINYVGVHRDITHEVRLEKELRQAQKMEAIGRLAGGIAHDFNNILMAILGFTEMARSRIPENNPARNNLDQVLKASSRAADLVKQILAYSRQTEQERTPIFIAPLLTEALKLLRSSLPSTIEIRQEISPAGEGSVVLADSTQIHQVIMNLCTNAAHAMRSKGGLLSLELSEVDVDELHAAPYTDLKPGPYVRLAVNDTGHGIEAMVIDRIFDPFFTTKGVGEGTGMGLAVVLGIVSSYGGVIKVHSEVDKGTTFHVFLPRVEEKIASRESGPEVLPTGREHILFVDDESDLAELGKEALESLGYTVSAKTVSVEALEDFRARPNAFDLLITDMTMPGLTGRDLARQVRSIRPDMPIILCSGFSEVLDERSATDAGIHEFVMKPYTVTNLAKTIRKVLNRASG